MRESIPGVESSCSKVRVLLARISARLEDEGGTSVSAPLSISIIYIRKMEPQTLPGLAAEKQKLG